MPFCHCYAFGQTGNKEVQERQMVGYVAVTPSPQETRQGLRRAPVVSPAAGADWFLPYGRPPCYWAHLGALVGPGHHSSRHPPKLFVGVNQLVRCQEEKGCQWFCTIYLHRRGGTEKPSQGQPVCRSSGHPLLRQGDSTRSPRNMIGSHLREEIST